MAAWSTVLSSNGYKVKVHTMSAKTETIERTVDHEVDSERSYDDALATLSEREENRVQMQEIKRRTVEPGVMLLSVKRVVSAENSQKWAIDIDHPVRDDDNPIRVFVDKPTTGWTRDYEIVLLLEWYGIHDQDPHQLEFVNVYLKKDDERSDYAHGWMLIEPPDYEAPMRVQLQRHKKRLSTDFRPTRTNAKMWTMLLAGSVGGALFPTPDALFLRPFIVATAFVLVTIFGMAVMDND